MKKLEATKEQAERLVDLILKKIPKKHMPIKKKRTKRGLVDGMTDKMLRALHGIDALAAIADPTGACCLRDGGCDNTSQANCDGVGGVYQGNDTKCSVSLGDGGVVCGVPL